MSPNGSRGMAAWDLPKDARPTSPSGVPLASASTENDGSSRPCVRAPGPYTWCLAGLAVVEWWEDVLNLQLRLT